MDLRETYNQIAEDWCTDHASDTWWIEGTDAFAALLPRPATVLDVGCAGGIKTKYLCDKGLQVTGIDFSEKMIAIAQRDVPYTTFLVRDITQPLGLSEPFDGIFAQAVLLHIAKRDVSRVLTNLTNALKPGGILYAAVKEPRPGNPEEEMVKENDYGYDYQRFFSYFRREELEENFRKAGLNVLRSSVNPSGHTNWVQVIAEKPL